jgi:hypothetical protein
MTAVTAVQFVNDTSTAAILALIVEELGAGLLAR